MSRPLTRLVGWLGRAELVVAELCLVAMVVVVALQVFCRYALNSPLLWPEELATLSLIYLTFIGASAALKKRRHIAIDYFSKLWGPGLQLYLDVMIDVLVLVFLAVVVLEAVRLYPAESRYTAAVLRIPRSLYTAPLTVSAVSSALTVVAELSAKAGRLPSSWRRT